MESTLFKGRTFVALDLETTGLKSKVDRIIEVGAVKYRDGAVVDKFDQLVNPGMQLTNLSEAITGISAKDVEHAPRFEQIREQLTRFIGDGIIVGHNIQFDIDFLEQNGIDLSGNASFDTYHLASILLPGMPSYSLATLTKELGIQQPVSHRALNDAISSLDLLRHLFTVAQEIPNDVLREIVTEVRKSEWDEGELFIEVLQHGSPRTPSRFTRDVLPHPPEIRRRRVTWQWDSTEVVALFESGGLLEKLLPGFHPRNAQIEYVRHFADAVSGKNNLIAEAATGTGKTLAYLIPGALWALSSGERAVVATYTLALQEQIRMKDSATVAEVIRQMTGSDIRIAYMKGRANYLCRNRFNVFRSKRTLSDEEVRLVVKVLLWLTYGDTFERSELALARGEEYVWQRICSEREFCRGPQCVTGKGCAIQNAKQLAEDADVIIANQALLASDIRFGRALLPEYSIAVVDEAHHLADVVTDRFATTIQSKTWDDLCEDISSAVHSVSDTDDAFPEVRAAVKELRERGTIFFGFLGILTKHLCDGVPVGFRADALIDEYARESWEWHSVDKSGSVILSFLRDCRTFLESQGMAHPEKPYITVTAGAVREAEYVIESFLVPADDIVRTTIYANGSLELTIAPLSVATILRKELYISDRSILLTSATLSMSGNFAYMRKLCGLDDTWDELITSPVFDYLHHARVIVPTSFPNPLSPKYPSAVTQVITDVVTRLHGKTLVLVTSYREVERLYAEITLALRGDGITVLGQKISGRHERLTKSFADADAAVLIGTSAFWEGIDVPGEKLSCVVIPKLPFDVPVDPTYIARSRMYEDGFREYGLPRAVISFKQGFGRLIRSTTDYGAVIVLDTRLIEKSYGEEFLRSIPDVTVERGDRDEVALLASDFITHHGEKNTG